MRAHLVRKVCRYSRVHHGLLMSLSPLPTCALPRHTGAGSSVIIRHAPRRSLFGVFQKPPRQVKSPEIEPGYLTLLQFRNHEKKNLRPPPSGTLISGFREFFNFKNRFKKKVNATQAFCALRLLLHLRKFGETRDGLTIHDLEAARESLLRPPGVSDDSYLTMCREIHAEICQRTSSSWEGTSTFRPSDLNPHISALCQYGAALEAADLLTKLEKEHSPAGRDWEELWLVVLAGLAREGKEVELLARAEAAEGAGFKYTPVFHEIMTTFFARRKEFQKAKTWFSKTIVGKLRPTPATYTAILHLAQHIKGQDDWTKVAYQDLCDSNPHKELWDVVFQWAVIVFGKGADDIKRMMDTMVLHNKNKPAVRPDIATINGIVQAASSKKDNLLAERFVQMGIDMGLSPDFHTYSLQLDYRLEANDASGAAASFENLQANVPRNIEELPAVNKYIRYLCSASKLETAKLLEVLNIVEEFQIPLEPASVVALCMTFLQNDQQYDVIDTLSLHTLLYSLEERGMVRDAFVGYCVDSNNSTARVWDAHSLLRQYFPETQGPDRMRIVRGFFQRRRADMACSVFGYMRKSDNPKIRPSGDDYVAFFEQLGRVPHAPTLNLVHNMLKMDSTVQMDTRTGNALMIAYTACENPDQAMEFWHDIAHSTEGPSYRSLDIVFRTCQVLPYADATAREIWAKIQRMEIEVPSFVFTAYAAAMAGQGHLDEVQKLISGMDKSVGYGPDLNTLGIPYNAFLTQDLRDRFETWAATYYPNLWEQLRTKKKKAVKGAAGPVDLKIRRDMMA